MYDERFRPVMDCDASLEEKRVSTRFTRLFGISEPTENAARLVKILAILFPSFALSFQISTTFYMIFIAETLGGGDYITGLTYVGILVITSLLSQTILDYPTGAIGDWIGQRYVISSALLCYSVAFWITSQVNPTTPFPVFMTIYILMGVGAAQESGAFQAWFDNNWKVCMPHDEDRKQYGVFWGRVGMVWQVSSTLVLIPGSWLALVFSRSWVFQLQAIFAFLLALAVLRLVHDLPGVRDESEGRPSLQEYGGLLKEGVRFLGSSRFVTFIILGEVVMWSTGPVWWNLLLFPLYFTFLLSDVAVSSFRTIIFLPQALSQERSGIWSRRFEPKVWIPRFRFLQFGGFIFYILLVFVTSVFPPASPLSPVVPILDFPIDSLIPTTIIFFVFVVTSMFGGFAQILSQRVMIDVIPSKIRNSMYSLQPTLIMLASAPLIALFGWLTPLYGFPLTFALCSIVTFTGALLVRKAFTYPIIKADEVQTATEEEVSEIHELDVT
ncbi:MAG: MFS transporter [Candidatus Thorarchaeota archaeon]|jgi:MFS family permease